MDTATDNQVKAEEQQKARNKKVKEALAKSQAKTAKKKAQKKAPKSPRVTIDSFTMDLVRRPNGVTLDEARKLVVAQFPKRDRKTLENTTQRRLKGYLAAKYGQKIVKDDQGRYYVKQKKSA